tara:strand:+ start:714 stop:839 length:126 start_codon:yes stop_codon:yes gene_type:complete
MQTAVGLKRAVIDRHARSQRVVGKSHYLDAEVTGHGAFLEG